MIISNGVVNAEGKKRAMQKKNGVLNVKRKNVGQ